MLAEDLCEFFKYLGTDISPPPEELTLKVLKGIFPTLNVVKVPTTTKLLKAAWGYKDKEDHLIPYLKDHECFELVDFDTYKLVCIKSKFHKKTKSFGDIHIVKKRKEKK